jgi:hypothetical protein
MDKKVNKILFLTGVTLVLVGVFGLFSLNKPDNAGSVSAGGVYRHASSTTDAGMKILVANKPATLGSVIVASTTNATFTIWNATSTTDTASNTVASFPALVGAGTYTFDITVPRGLIIKPGVGFLGQYITTFR